MATTTSPQVRFLAGLVVVASALLLAAGSWPLRTMAWDVFVLLDGGWRLSCGLAPHRDYSSAIGILPQALIAWPMSFFGPSARALAQGPALVLPLIFLWSGWVARARLPPRLAFAFTAAVTFLWIGPYTHGLLPWWSSYAMYYNRMAWSLWLILGLEAFFAPAEDSPQVDTRGAISSGIAATLLFLTKINYFATGVGLFVAGLALRHGRGGRPGARLAIFGGSALLALFAAHLVLPLDLAAQTRDLGDLSRCFDLRSHLLAFLWIVQRHPLLWGLAALALVLERRAMIPLLAGTVVMMQNMNDSTVPLLGFVLLCVAEGRRRAGRAAPLVTNITYLLVIAPALLDYGAFLGVSTWKLARSADLPPYQKIHTSTLEDLVFIRQTPESALEKAAFALVYDREWPPKLDAVLYAQSVNDGLLLLLRHTEGKGTVVALDFINPFNVALGLTPPRGSALSWHYGRTLCPANVPPPSWGLADADWVMAPRIRVLDDSGAFLYSTYKEHLTAHYEEKATSTFWILLGKKKAAEAGSP